MRFLLSRYIVLPACQAQELLKVVSSVQIDVAEISFGVFENSPKNI